MSKIELTLEITNYCTNECLHCSSESSREGLYLPLYIIKDFVIRNNPSLVNISGGEPLLHPDMMSILQFLRSNCNNIKLYSGGNIEVYSMLTASQLVDSIALPMHSDNANEHDYITCYKESFNYMMDNLSVLVNNSVSVEINIVPMSINLDKIEGMLDLISDLGVKKANILRLVEQGRCKYNKHLVPDRELELEKISTVSNRKDIEVRVGHPYGDNCIANTEKKVLTARGREIPCESFKDGYCKCAKFL